MEGNNLKKKDCSRVKLINWDSVRHYKDVKLLATVHNQLCTCDSI